MKYNVLGVLIDGTSYREATAAVLNAARDGLPFALTALAVHGVMTGVQDPQHGARLNSLDMVTPDGQPVRWAMNAIYKVGLPERVYGPFLTLRVLQRAASEGIPIYLYGSTAETLEKLVSRLQMRHPGLKVAGYEPSKFRNALPREDIEIADRIKGSGARLVLVGLGCPRQETFVYAMRSLLPMPLLAVGAAFDYHAGNLTMPPKWIQDHGLEWVWRLASEKRRLWKRYLLLNPAYLARLTAQRLGWWRAIPLPPATERPTTFAV